MALPETPTLANAGWAYSATALSVYGLSICKCSTIGPKASAGTKVSAPTISTVTISNTANNGVWSAACRDRPAPSFWRPRTGNRQHRNHQPIAGEQHRQPQPEVVKRHVGRQAAESAAVVVAGRRPGVQHFAETVGTGVEDRALPASSIRLNAVPPNTINGGIKMTMAAIFISNASIFLPDTPGCGLSSGQR